MKRFLRQITGGLLWLVFLPINFYFWLEDFDEDRPRHEESFYRGK